MNFKQRLRFFLIGFVPGLIILLFIINKTGCTSPNELKILELSHQTLSLGDKALCKLKCMQLTEQQFKSTLQYFEVNYDLSDVHKKPYGLYYLQAIKKSKDYYYELVVEDRDTVSYINDIKSMNPLPSCNCDTIKN